MEVAVEQYCAQLRRRQIEGSYLCAKRTAELLRTLITSQRHADASSLINEVRAVGARLQAAKPVELAIGNIVRRVLHYIREEQQQEEEEEAGPAPQAANAAKQEPGLLSQAFRPGPPRGVARAMSLSNLLDRPSAAPGDAAAAAADAPAPGSRAGSRVSSSGGGGPGSEAGEAAGAKQAGGKQAGSAAGGGSRRGQWRSKQTVIELLNELIDELDGIEGQIAHQAVEHIHANEVILTYGMSDTTLRFLREANKRRDFQVVVSEAAPRYDGHAMARLLSEAGLQTTLIADSAVFAMMARANKVLVGAHAVLANGGVIAPSGMHMVALAARRHSIPFVVLVGLHKLSPVFPHDPDIAYNDFKSPAAVADFDVVAEAFAQRDAGGEALSLEVVNPAYDYIPPDLVSLFVTDTGGYTPSYVYRLLTDFYFREDYLLTE